MASKQVSQAEQEFLDAVFDQALGKLEDGLTVLAEDLLDGREGLRDEVRRLVQLAHEVVVGRPPGAPQVPGYSILSELGRGGMATVYLARQERAGGRLVALKVLPASLNLHGKSRARFEQEALSVARLRHPHIVTVYDVVAEPQVQAYAMEWVEGKSLAQIIEHLKERQQQSSTRSDQTAMDEVRGLLDADQRTIPDTGYTVFICRLGIAIARALSAVHQAGLLHRDVKPSNILLRRDGTPLLSDFGLVREAQSALMTQEGQFLGTPAYAAPEQLRGTAAAIDARSDVYALGVTLYHALSLVLPFPGATTDELLRQIESGKAKPLRRITPKLPRDLETIVARAMETDPERRYQSLAELGDDLERLLSLQPIKARPAGLVSRTLKLARRNRASLFGILGGAILALIAVSAAAVYLWVLPQWSRDAATQARLSLLHPDQANAIYNAEFLQANDPRAGSNVNGIENALTFYDRALRYAPFNQELAAERHTVDAARKSLATARPDLLGGKVAPPPPSSASQFPSEDLRLAGLFAFLTGNAPAAVDAWSKLDLVAEPDPFVEAALGQLYLVRGEPARAYPRLRKAWEAFPNVSFLSQYLADAAVQCGDLEKAEQWIKLAASQPMRDHFEGWRRVDANRLARLSRDQEAVAIYQSSPTGTNPVSDFEYAQFLESRGRLFDAAKAFAQVSRKIPNAKRPHAAFVRVMDAWWESLTDPERQRILRGALDGAQDEFLQLLRQYEKAMGAGPINGPLLGSTNTIE